MHTLPYSNFFFFSKNKRKNLFLSYLFMDRFLNNKHNRSLFVAIFDTTLYKIHWSTHLRQARFLRRQTRFSSDHNQLLFLAKHPEQRSFTSSPGIYWWRNHIFGYCKGSELNPQEVDRWSLPSSQPWHVYCVSCSFNYVFPLAFTVLYLTAKSYICLIVRGHSATTLHNLLLLSELNAQEGDHLHHPSREPWVAPFIWEWNWQHMFHAQCLT